MRAVIETQTGDQAPKLPDDSGMGRGTTNTNAALRRILKTVSLDFLQGEGRPLTLARKHYTLLAPFFHKWQQSDKIPSTMGDIFSHLDPATGAARMVDVSAKAETHRTARAAGSVTMNADLRRLVADKALPKGDVFTVARIAGIQAAKRTGDWIPMCHPLPLTNIQVDLILTETGVDIEAISSCVGRTGVEMEALVAVSAAALTIYDMCKSVDKSMVIGDIRLLEKTGGKSGEWKAGE